MPETFDPLSFIFVPFEPVDERPARVAYTSAACFRSHMEVKARGISTEASRRLGEQWPQLLDAVLLQETARMCVALRAGFAEYQALN